MSSFSVYMFYHEAIACCARSRATVYDSLAWFCHVSMFKSKRIHCHLFAQAYSGVYTGVYSLTVVQKKSQIKTKQFALKTLVLPVVHLITEYYGCQS